MAFHLPGTYLERQKQSQGVFQVMFVGGNSLVPSFLNLSRQLYMCKYRCHVYIFGGCCPQQGLPSWFQILRRNKEQSVQSPAASETRQHSCLSWSWSVCSGGQPKSGFCVLEFANYFQSLLYFSQSAVGIGLCVCSLLSK